MSCVEALLRLNNALVSFSILARLSPTSGTRLLIVRVVNVLVVLVMHGAETSTYAPRTPHIVSSLCFFFAFYCCYCAIVSVSLALAPVSPGRRWQQRPETETGPARELTYYYA
jgi:hypothetical protein